MGTYLRMLILHPHLYTLCMHAYNILHIMYVCIQHTTHHVRMHTTMHTSCTYAYNDTTQEQDQYLHILQSHYICTWTWWHHICHEDTMYVDDDTIYIYMYDSIYIYIYIYTMYVHMCAWTCWQANKPHMYIYTYICTCTYTTAYMYIHYCDSHFFNQGVRIIK